MAKKYIILTKEVGKKNIYITKEVVNKKNIFPKGIIEKEPYIACAENNRKLTTLETRPPSNLDM